MKYFCTEVLLIPKGKIFYVINFTVVLNPFFPYSISCSAMDMATPPWVSAIAPESAFAKTTPREFIVNNVDPASTETLKMANPVLKSAPNQKIFFKAKSRAISGPNCLSSEGVETTIQIQPPHHLDLQGNVYGSSQLRRTILRGE